MLVTLLPRCCARALVSRGRSWLAIIGLMWGIAEAPAFAAETQNNKTSRLGFSFDQRAHDAAVATEQKRRSDGTLDDEPTPVGVVRLPKYVVTERALPLEEHEILTPKGKVELAKKRYTSPLYQKTLGPLAAVASLLNNPLGGWNPNGPEAMAIYEDNEALRRKNRTKELSALAEFAEKVKKPKKGDP